MVLLIKNIKELIQVRETLTTFVSGKEMSILPSIKNAFLLIEDDTIIDFGSMAQFKEISVDKTIDATGKIVMPTYCDSHTHIVYAGNRELEFVDRINGLSYEEIANELAIPLGTVKAQLFRAKQLMSAQLQRPGATAYVDVPASFAA